MENGAASTQAEVQAVFAFYEASECTQKKKAWLSALPIVIQNPSQQFLWFLVAHLSEIKAMRAQFETGDLAFVYTDLAIQVLHTEAPNARAATQKIQPSVNASLLK